MATFYGETMTKFLGLDETVDKAPVGDFGGKVRVINERISLADGFAVNDVIIFARVPQNARIVDIRMQADVEIDADVLFSIGIGADDPEKYANDLDFTSAGRFAPYMVSVTKPSTVGIPLPAVETLSLTVLGEAVSATADQYIHFQTLYTLD